LKTSVTKELKWIKISDVMKVVCIKFEPQRKLRWNYLRIWLKSQLNALKNVKSGKRRGRTKSSFKPKWNDKI